METDHSPALPQDPTFAAVVQEKAILLDNLPREDLFLKLHHLEQHLEFLGLQEEYIKDEQRNLQRELLRAQEEVKRSTYPSQAMFGPPVPSSLTISGTF